MAKFKVLLNDPTKTATIIVALRERKQSAIDTINKLNETDSIETVKKYYQGVIAECNDVLDAIGVD